MDCRYEEDAIVFCEGGQTILTLKEFQQEDGILLEFSGELRSEVSHHLLDEMVALATVGAQIRADLKNVTYICPTTQHMFLKVQQRLDALKRGSLTLRNLPAPIYGEFEKSGVSELLMIE